MSEKTRLHATVHGDVQGVSFRYYTLKQARSLDVVGWVRNLWDGSVEIVAEDDRETLDKLLVWLNRGPPAATVERVDVEWQPATGRFRQFEVHF